MINRQKLIEKDYVLYLINYFGRMQTWKHEDVLSEIARKVKEAKPIYQPPADQWIPCSSGKMPEHEADVLITLESLFKRRYAINARYFAEMGVVYEDEWTGEGFYTYDSEYGWGKHEGVIAWMPAEPYMGVE